MKAIRILANMGGSARYNYDFTGEDVEILATALDAEVTRLRNVMHAPGHQLDIVDLIREDD
jgi:hypothetical protein